MFPAFKLSQFDLLVLNWASDFLKYSNSSQEILITHIISFGLVCHSLLVIKDLIYLFGFCTIEKSLLDFNKFQSKLPTKLNQNFESY